MLSQNARREIHIAAALYGRTDLAPLAIADGISPREFRAILEAEDRTKRRDTFGFTRAELDHYPYRDAVLAAMNDKPATGRVREMSDQIARMLPPDVPRRGGVLVPMGASSRTALTSVTSTAASQLVFTRPGTLIEKLRARLVATRLGATFLPGLTGPVGFPRQTASGTAYWVSENPTNDVTETALGVDLVTMTPKTIQATQATTRQLLAQDAVPADAMIENDLVKLHGNKIDTAVIHGAGSGNEPTGIYAASGVNTVAVGATSTSWYAKLVDMATEIALDDADVDRMGFATTPGFAGKLMQTLNFPVAGAGAAIWNGTHGDGMVAGYKAVASNSLSSTLGVSSNEHAAVFGNFADCLIGSWGVLELIVDPYSKKKKGIIEITSFQMVDIQLRHGQSFCKATGIKIS